MSRMLYLSLVLTFILASCNTEDFPVGGYQYPGSITTPDTNHYSYPVKDSGDAEDIFYRHYQYLFYRPLNEPNMSLKAFPTTTYRLTFSAGLRYSLVATFTNEKVVLKEGSPYILYKTDTSAFTAIEKFHFNTLQYRYPFKRWKEREYVNQYLDSLSALYPELLDPAYYHSLYKKSIGLSGDSLRYIQTSISIANSEFKRLQEAIDTSGFWTSPIELDCEVYANGGTSFSLEANTQKRYNIVYTAGCNNSKFTKACRMLQNYIGIIRKDTAHRSTRTDTITYIHTLNH